ncbi:hypothetical protein [Chamaesiphon sp. VAR_69_metabat_338]|uniref:hypothetical protein n=1 Tax=Chamaesiphon sp. VAR_69_metabat_338 TaxID=2964704 RepID=UPI00286E5602|nr:hypothetical protein [Chamaesiphon sp. VAR_69_metabat_338]
MEIKLELITGDVNQVGDLDFLLMGHKNHLRDRILKETDSKFDVLEAKSWLYSNQYELLEAPEYKWKRIAAINFRPNSGRSLSETQFSKISRVISVALKSFNAQSIGILPPTWRNPRYCALGVIYSLWITAYSNQANAVAPYNILQELYPSPASTNFKIISLTGTEYFEEVLQDDCKLMWNFIKAFCKQQNANNAAWFSSPQYKQFKKYPVTFNISKEVINE